MDYSKLTSIKEELPTPTGTRGNYLCLLNDPYGGNNGTPVFKICYFDALNNTFEGFPAGAREVTHWMDLQECVEDNDLVWCWESRKFIGRD